MIKQKEEKNLIVGLDIGTSKIVAIVAELQPDGLLNVIGLGQHSSKGLKKGVVLLFLLRICWVRVLRGSLLVRVGTCMNRLF